MANFWKQLLVKLQECDSWLLMTKLWFLKGLTNSVRTYSEMCNMQITDEFMKKKVKPGRLGIAEGNMEVLFLPFLLKYCKNGV